MCYGFGMIVTKNLKGYFVAPDSQGNISHSDILAHAPVKENKDPYVRNFVRIECPKWTMESFRFDENGSLPGWAEEHTDEIKALVEKTLKKVNPLRRAYQKQLKALNKGYETKWSVIVKAREVAQNKAYTEESEAKSKAKKAYRIAYKKLQGKQREMAAKLTEIFGKEWHKFFEKWEVEDKKEWLAYRKIADKIEAQRRRAVSKAYEDFQNQKQPVYEAASKAKSDLIEKTNAEYAKIPGFVS